MDFYFGEKINKKGVVLFILDVGIFCFYCLMVVQTWLLENNVYNVVCSGARTKSVYTMECNIKCNKYQYFLTYPFCSLSFFALVIYLTLFIGVLRKRYFLDLCIYEIRANPKKCWTSFFPEVYVHLTSPTSIKAIYW